MSISILEQFDLPQFKDIDSEKVPTLIKDLLHSNQDKLTSILKPVDAYTWDNLMQPLEEMSDKLHKKWSPIAHLHAVLESPPLRQAYNTAQPLITEYYTQLGQNESLYKAIKSLTENEHFHELNAAQHKILEHEIRDFKLSGIHLPKEQKAKFAELQKELSEKTTRFAENLLDATAGWTLTITDPRKIANLPPQDLKLAEDNAKQRGIDGYVITLDYPSYSAAIKFLDDREIRKTLYTAYTTRASDRGPCSGKWDNSKIMEDILRLRHEIAHLIGFTNYAEYSLVTKMAKNPSRVLSFLKALLDKAKPVAKVEWEEVSALAKKIDGLTTLEAYDLPYYSEKLRKAKYAITEEAVRVYFPIDHVLNGMFTLVQKVFGITIQEVRGVAAWHQDVRFFSIYDDSGALCGGFYTDLYARAHKRDGAWMDDYCSRRRLASGKTQFPIAFLTCNFMPPVDQKGALLTHNDVITLFHEFGHCLHHLLTKVDYTFVAGINGVPWDAVEFPSQFMENWCWEKEALALISSHYQTGESLPDDLYQKMINAKYFQTGLQFIRQLEFSLFDFRLHLEYDPKQPGFIQTMLNEIRNETAVYKTPEFNRFQNSFSHIFAGGYAAGYYSYKWAEVLSADAFDQFEKQKSNNGTIFNPAIGRAFMHNILETGGVRDPLAAFIAFCGHEPDINALIRQSGLTQPNTIGE